VGFKGGKGGFRGDQVFYFGIDGRLWVGVQVGFWVDGVVVWGSAWECEVRGYNLLYIWIVMGFFSGKNWILWKEKMFFIL